MLGHSPSGREADGARILRVSMPRGGAVGPRNRKLDQRPKHFGGTLIRKRHKWLEKKWMMQKKNMGKVVFHKWKERGEIPPFLLV